MKTFDIEARLAGLLPSARQVIEIELWYRRTEQVRQAVEQNVTSLVSAAGGRVLMRAVIEDIGYHALKCDVPVALLQRLARRDFAQVQLVRSPDVIYLRVAGQTLLPLQQEKDSAPLDSDAPLPSGAPVVCLLDGVPVSNHRLLANRVIVYDPDELSGDMETTGALRKHGTAMASAIVWGDRSSAELPTARPLLVRPILTPSTGTVDQVEEVADNQLTPDLMWRVFRELFEGDDNSAPIGSDVVIVNLSVADPATPFDTILSSWARMLDWLSYTYGVLVIVSAGNHCHLPTSPTDPATIISLTGEQRRAAINQAMYDHQVDRRLLSPAESINAVTVGALHSDAASDSPLGYRFDPSDGLPMASPITSLGSGYRRSVKPELVAPGGRAYFATPIVAGQVLTLRESTERGPGILVASPTPGREVFTLGTSPATALTTRQAADLYETINSIIRAASLTRRQQAVGIKALLIHGARFPEGCRDGSVTSRTRAWLWSCFKRLRKRLYKQRGGCPVLRQRGCSRRTRTSPSLTGWLAKQRPKAYYRDARLAQPSELATSAVSQGIAGLRGAHGFYQIRHCIGSLGWNRETRSMYCETPRVGYN